MRTKRRWIKYWIGQLHLWLGLASGIVVVIVSITGCLFVFQKEITEALFSERYFVTPPAERQTLPLSLLLEKAQRTLRADRPVDNIVTYRSPDRAWEFMTYKSNDTALTYFGAVEYYQSVLINPYTGVITGIRDYKHDFFSIIKYVHWSLLLNSSYGQPIVGWSTFIFVLLLLSGLVLWWPKKWTKALRDRSFTIKWKASFKRVNYDLHNVPGFYILLPALVIAMTGMVFAFGWFQAAVYVVAAGTTSPPVQAVVRSIPLQDSASHPLDMAYEASLRQLPAALRLNISPASGKEGTIGVWGYRRKETFYGADVLQFDRYSGKLLHRLNNGDKNRGQRLIEMNYDIHVGAIAGITGKVIAFIISLVCASLPITGFLIWWGKRRRAPRAA